MEYNIYLSIAVFATAIFLIKTVLMFIGLDTDVDGDFDLNVNDFEADDFDGTDSFNVLSFQSILSFLMMFGWSGLALRYEFELTKYPTIGLAALVGVFSALVISLLLFQFKKLATKPLKGMPEEGACGVVYLRIPANGRGIVKVSHNGTQREFPATSVLNIKSSTPIKVTSVVNNMLHVEPLKKGVS